jgi:hypothetical protein
MPEQTQLQDVNNSAEAAAYIADLSLDLAQIARRHGLDALGFILDMAHAPRSGGAEPYTRN